MKLDHLLPVLLMQAALVLGVSRIVGILFRRFHQPQVVGEMLAGILLGPSLLGWATRHAHQAGWLQTDYFAVLFPASSITYLGVLSQVGVIFFLFLVGLELDPKLLRNRGHQAVVISHASIVAPFLLGGALTLFLYPRLFQDTQQMRFTPVALFMGAAMSITAFPVLARILTERNLHKTKVGAVSITCAAIDDVTAWCMLAFVVGVARAEGIVTGLWTAGLSTVYVVLMFFVVRPFLARLQAAHERQGRVSQNVFAVIVLLTLLSAWATEKIGIHALFGAFLMGAMMPKGTSFVRAVTEKMEDYIVVFLLPIFFAYTGLRTEIGLLNSFEMWGYTLLIIVVACAGKFGGSTLAGRAVGLSWRESGTVGILMNTRGLMELVILNIGRDLGVITPAVFAMMVIMALATTAMTTPVLQWIFPQRLYDPNLADGGGNGPSTGVRGVTSPLAVLLPVADPKIGGPLLRLAQGVAGPDESNALGKPLRRIFALHLMPPRAYDAYREGVAVPTPAAEPDSVLEPLLELAAQRGVKVEPITFTSPDVAGTIAAITRLRRVDLVLMGSHRPVLGKSLLSGKVYDVITQTPADVGILVDRGLPETGPLKVLVPYRSGPDDRLALALAARLAVSGGAVVTVLHVVPPNRSAKDVAGVEQAVSELKEQSSAESTLKVVEHDSPIDAVLASAEGQDLIIVAATDAWGLESHRYGILPERMARLANASFLFVRKNT